MSELYSEMQKSEKLEKDSKKLFREKLSSNHWDRNQCAVVVIRTTGPCFWWHEIMEICIISLDSTLKPRDTVMPFSIMIKPNHPERICKSYVKSQENFHKAIQTGFDSEQAKDMLLDWFHGLGLERGSMKRRPRKVMLLGHRVAAHVIPFLRFWIDGPGYMVEEDGSWQDLYGSMFHWHIKDLQIACDIIDEQADCANEQIPFPKIDLTYICNMLNVKRERRHYAITDADAIAKCYRRLSLMRGYL